MGDAITPGYGILTPAAIMVELSDNVPVCTLAR